MASIAKELAFKSYPFIRIFEDGTVERIPFILHMCPHLLIKIQKLASTPRTSPSQTNPNSQIAFSSRISLKTKPKSFPSWFTTMVVPFAWRLPSHSFTNVISSACSEAKVVAVSVEYRLASENPLPIAYEDCWAALQWVASHSINKGSSDSIFLLLLEGDFFP
ncbi:hypothetical protein C1H46_024117 [Malus baccata]|uniref:Alpha/beta hydrolase fold-3 domain-containing protein n=1 Tax=Malus baccata TaxID=106549 RepID=A0A540LVD2_MALBA|nr:hypothetical protein C1H46_024117 [Malus baccata]